LILVVDLWLDWIDDCKLLASSNKEKEDIIQLYLTAVKDYQDTDIWKSLFEYLLEECSDDEYNSSQWISLDEIRKISQKAMKSVGRHYLDAHTIFNFIIEIEQLFFFKVWWQNIMFADLF
jgi:hypothetical protein